jgi:hypothetical protein
MNVHLLKIWRRKTKKGEYQHTFFWSFLRFSIGFCYRYTREMEEYKRKKEAGEFIPPLPTPAKVKAKPGPKGRSKELLAIATAAVPPSSAAETESLHSEDNHDHHDDLSHVSNGSKQYEEERNGKGIGEEVEEDDETITFENLKEEQQQEDLTKPNLFYVYSSFSENDDEEDMIKSTIDKYFSNSGEANKRVCTLFFKENPLHLNEETLKEKVREIRDDAGLLTLVYNFTDNSGGQWKVGCHPVNGESHLKY